MQARVGTVRTRLIGRIDRHGTTRCRSSIKTETVVRCPQIAAGLKRHAVVARGQCRQGLAQVERGVVELDDALLDARPGSAALGERPPDDASLWVPFPATSSPPSII